MDRSSIIGRGIAGILTIVLGLWMNFLLMPAWNFRSAGMYGFILLVAFIGIVIFGIVEYMMDEEFYGTMVLIAIFVLQLIILIIGGLASSHMFHAEAYYNMKSFTDGSFEADIPVINNENTAVSIVDLNTARNLGDRTVGGIQNSSWYEVDDEYNLIKYQGEYYRISELNYGGLFKYKKAKEIGIPGYVLVNVKTQEAKYVELEEPIKYSPSGHYSYLLHRHLRKLYPSYMFGTSYFEIDEEGNPYYITAVERPTIGLFGGKIESSFILTRATDGESQEYSPEELPEWIEHAYSLEYLMRVTEYHQKYANGWLNSWTSQTGVTHTTYSYKSLELAGYNTAITSNGEVVFYTGVTPSSQAESNIGFILANPRTGEIKYYSCTGAEESSAQEAAESLVQNLGYVATFPTIVNVDNVETYFMLLKDKAGLVQRYALCNIKDYTKVVQAETLETAISLYHQKLGINGQTPETDDKTSKNGTIENLYQAQIEGYTYYYFTLTNEEGLYMSSIVNSNKQVLLTEGSKVYVEYVPSNEEGVYLVSKINIQ